MKLQKKLPEDNGALETAGSLTEFPAWIKAMEVAAALVISSISANILYQFLLWPNAYPNPFSPLITLYFLGLGIVGLLPLVAFRLFAEWIFQMPAKRNNISVESRTFALEPASGEL